MALNFRTMYKLAKAANPPTMQQKMKINKALMSKPRPLSPGDREILSNVMKSGQKEGMLMGNQVVKSLRKKGVK